jgi:hypothetical protein
MPATGVLTKVREKVAVEAKLLGLLKEWDAQEKKVQGYWKKVVEYCAENEVKNKELEQGLIQARGMEEVTARNEASKILKAAHIEEAIEALAEGETVSYVKNEILPKYEAVKGKKHEYKPRDEGPAEVDGDQRFAKSLQRIAMIAIKEREMVKIDLWIDAAKTAWRDAYQKFQKELNAQKGDGEQEANKNEEEE